MRKVVQVQEVEGEGLEALLDQEIILFCVNYFYAGKLTGINDTCVLLENGGIVYETGSFNELKWKDFQKVADKLYVRLDSIESFAKGK
jgi:hypothetical protein